MSNIVSYQETTAVANRLFSRYHDEHATSVLYPRLHKCSLVRHCCCNSSHLRSPPEPLLPPRLLTLSSFYGLERRTRPLHVTRLNATTRTFYGRWRRLWVYGIKYYPIILLAYWIWLVGAWLGSRPVGVCYVAELAGTNGNVDFFSDRISHSTLLSTLGFFTFNL